MRPVATRAYSCHGSASRRRQCFVAAPVSKKTETPAKNKTEQ
ncbi:MULTISPECIES: hypothetical protein [Vibrio]|nr:MULTISPECIES: hypothetical protein [Vibrio]